MPAFQYYTADVFTNERFGGNQLAVFPNAEGLSAEVMARIAREFNFSETTFVFPPSESKHTRRVRIFTPVNEIPFAGHPTVGTAFVLATIGDVKLTGDETRIVFEEGVGPVAVTVRAKNGVAGFAQLSAAKMPEFGPPPPSGRTLARALGLSADDVLSDGLFPEAVSCGLPFLFVPIKDRATLARIRVRLDDFENALGSYWAPMVFVFCDDPEREGSNYRARMFAPLINVPEDPATGSACAAFGGYLAKRDKRVDGTLRWVVEQGFEMGRPSILQIEVDKRGGTVIAVRVGGDSVLVSRGEFYI